MTESVVRRIWIAALTGIPFGVYKVGFGWYEFQHGHTAIGLTAMIWGIADIVLNVIAVAFPRLLTWCLLANIGRLLDGALKSDVWEKILLAVDTTASFLIVTAMIWLGRLPLEPAVMTYTWNVAVSCNVLAVGLEQLYRAIAGAKDK